GARIDPRSRGAGARGTDAVPAALAALSAAEGDLRDRAAGSRQHRRLLPRAAPRGHPAPGPTSPAHGRRPRRHGTPTRPEAARAPAGLGSDPRVDPRLIALPPRALCNDDARTRPGADTRRSAVWRRSSPAAVRDEDRLSAAIRGDRRPAPARL